MNNTITGNITVTGTKPNTKVTILNMWHNNTTVRQSGYIDGSDNDKVYFYLTDTQRKYLLRVHEYMVNSPTKRYMSYSPIFEFKEDLIERVLTRNSYNIEEGDYINGLKPIWGKSNV